MEKKEYYLIIDAPYDLRDAHCADLGNFIIRDADNGCYSLYGHGANDRPYGGFGCSTIKEGWLDDVYEVRKISKEIFDRHVQIKR
jgi:hypothetical protein